MSVPKINPDLYVGNTGKKLSDILTNANDILTNANDISTNKSNISVLNNKVNNVGAFLTSGTKTKTCTKDQQNFICQLNIPIGTWIIFGHWRQDGMISSSWTSIEGIDFTSPTSVYDDNGYCDMTVVGFHRSGATTAKLNLWPRGKNMTVKGELHAIRII